MPENRVRYLTIPRAGMELATILSVEDKGKYIDLVYQYFIWLEKGETPQLHETGSKVLDIALRETVSELTNGYNKYVQRMTARKKNTDHRSSTDTLEQDHRSSTDTSEPDSRYIYKNRTDKEQNRTDQEQIKTEQTITESDYLRLMKEGFSRNQIDEAVSRIDWNGIKHPYNYLMTVLKGSPQKQVSAQAYTQREYSADEESPEERMERYKAELQ